MQLELLYTIQALSVCYFYLINLTGQKQYMTKLK